VDRQKDRMSVFLSLSLTRSHLRNRPTSTKISKTMRMEMDTQPGPLTGLPNYIVDEIGFDFVVVASS